MSTAEKPKILVRPLQHRDLPDLKLAVENSSTSVGQSQFAQSLHHVEKWHGAASFLGLLSGADRQRHCLLVLESDSSTGTKGDRQLLGAIQVLPFNRSHTTWQISWTMLNPQSASALDSGSHLLRHCFEKIVEASNWVLEVDIEDKIALALYRQNGFQPLAQLTYWELPTEALQELADRAPDLPNLLPVHNTDAQLLYQLDTVSMPPLLRQVFDRQVHDFKTGLLQKAIERVTAQLDPSQGESYYVFESQRKAAIGYYNLESDGRSHTCNLTVHPAYTWLYPELLAQMANACQRRNSHLPLQLVSADYQPEREEYLQRIGAQRTKHSLLMSRSVWHKVREAKHLSLEGLQLSDVLSGLQPSRSPIPSRYELSSQPLDSEDQSDG
jgi:ribosomal protein S18 acetylase RimI-like enzyme